MSFQNVPYLIVLASNLIQLLPRQKTHNIDTINYVHNTRDAVFVQILPPA